MGSGFGSERLYKIRLSSGRVLGPIDRERVRLLILKRHVVGTESAREYPDGAWVDIHQIPAFADLLVAYIEGRLSEEQVQESEAAPYEPLPGSVGTTRIVSAEHLPQELGPAAPSGGVATKVLPMTAALARADGNVELENRTEDPGRSQPQAEAEEEKTWVGQLGPDTAQGPGAAAEDPHEDHTVVGHTQANEARGEAAAVSLDAASPGEESLELRLESTAQRRNVSQEPTVLFLSRPEGVAPAALGAKGRDVRAMVIRGVAILGVVFAGYEFFFEESPAPPQIRAAPIRALLPAPNEGKPNPVQGKELYDAGLREYAHDNVVGYRKAVARFRASATMDPNNARSYAMLASAYLQLIDSSNKDEKYFQVISKLLELARAKAPNLIETVIADIEFYVTVGKPEAAFQRMVEYTKDRTEYHQEHFYYMAYSMYHRGDFTGAAAMIANIPDNRVTTPRVFYLRGRIAERLNDFEAAAREYEKVIRLSPWHAKSYLRIAELRARQGKIKEIAKPLEFLVKNGELLDPMDLARTYYLQSQLFQVFERWDEALGAIDRAVVLDRDNADYILERYTLLTKVGDSIERVQGQARMYYFLSEGQRAAKSGNYRDAITYFLQARQNNPKSPLPLVRLGDMFLNSSDVVNARAYYEKATRLAPRAAEIWSKYIYTLIHCYEFEEAKKAMNQLKELKAGQSAVDKLSGDLYARQGRHTDAQAFYIKAMSRDTIDPTVYVAFANSLLETKRYQEAPFFFALARRFDPLNVEALLGTARAVAASEGPDRAIALLQDELQKGNPHRAELLTGVAEFQIQKGEWEAAQSFIDQASSLDPNYAPPFKLQAQIWLNKEHVVRTALDKALDAFKSYSDRNPSDPSGYLERYKIFVKKAEFEKADYELIRVHQVLPKFPNLHYYRGALYSLMGNHPLAVHEFEQELKNNPRGVGTLLALGKEYLEVGREADALSQFNAAMQLAPQMAEPKHWAGYANFVLKNYEGAVLLYRAAIQLDSGNPTIYKRLGMAYRAMGNGLEAKRAFKKYLEMEPDAPDRAEFERFL